LRRQGAVKPHSRNIQTTQQSQTDSERNIKVKRKTDFEEYLHNLSCTISPAFKEMTFASGKHLFMRWKTPANDMRIRFFIDIKECM
jgi:hypothetical protein